MTDVVPLAANQRLVETIISHFETNEHAALTAISRTTGNAITKSYAKPVKQILTEKSKQDMSLFIQEKQNLFMDETREARIWSHVAAHLQSEAFSEDLICNLATWVVEGLRVLTTEIENHPDTPLGWSRKPEVFVLGLQVIHAAELLLQLCDKTAVVSVSKKEVEESLYSFLAKGEQNGANVLWLLTMRDVLENVEV